MKVNVKVTGFIWCLCSALKMLRYGSHSFTSKSHHACLYLVSVHQAAPPLIVEEDV